MAQFAAPHRPVELLAGDDRAESAGHRAEQLELAHRQRQCLARGEHEPLLEPDLKLAGIKDVSGKVRALRVGRHDAQRLSCRVASRCKLVI